MGASHRHWVLSTVSVNIFFHLQREGPSAYHFKSTLVNQSKGSHYSIAESRTGGTLTRHDLSIQQLGEETKTQMGHFLLCGSRQLQDLHSKVELDHPRGEAAQVHKCIASHATGRGVFDGNVKVNRCVRYQRLLPAFAVDLS